MVHRLYNRVISHLPPIEVLLGPNGCGLQMPRFQEGWSLHHYASGHCYEYRHFGFADAMAMGFADEDETEAGHHLYLLSGELVSGTPSARATALTVRAYD